MRIIYLGDIVGNAGYKAVCSNIGILRNEYGADAVFANAENISGSGRGITADDYKKLRSIGLDVLSSGNHIWANKSIIPYLEEEGEHVIAPANFPHLGKIKGYTTTSIKGIPVTVINIIGRIFMTPVDCPFAKIDTILETIPKEHIIIVDIHAEATSEKKAFGFYVDGRVSVVVGTHTHVQTSDAMILPKGTGYITDLGMCGSELSVLGAEPSDSIFRLQHAQMRFLSPSGNSGSINGVLMDIDEQTKTVTNTEVVRLDTPTTTRK